MKLAKSAMLVSVTIINGGLLGERRDKTASALVESTYNISHRRAKASKYLIDRKHKSVKRVVAASQRVREVVYRYTVPWGDEKMRLLSTKLESQFKYDLNEALTYLETARYDYLHHYPALVAASERDLGELFDPQQYPRVDQIKDLFKSKVTYWPFPESNHFIAEIAEEASKKAKEAIESEIEERLLDATYDMVRRAKDVVQAYIDKLEKISPDEKGRSTGQIRDSLTDNLKDTARLIEGMNLTHNSQIKKVVLDLNRLAALYQASHMRYHLQHYPDRFFEKKQKGLEEANSIIVNLTMLDLKDQEVSDMVDSASDYMDM